MSNEFNTELGNFLKSEIRKKEFIKYFRKSMNISIKTMHKIVHGNFAYINEDQLLSVYDELGLIRTFRIIDPNGTECKVYCRYKQILYRFQRKTLHITNKKITELTGIYPTTLAMTFKYGKLPITRIQAQLDETLHIKEIIPDRVTERDPYILDIDHELTEENGKYWVSGKRI